jgi:hypothetical protein
MSRNEMFVRADTVASPVYPKDSAPYGSTMNELLTKYRQWITDIPTDLNPRYNYTSEKCKINQVGPVWFLADQGNNGKEIRSCSIPAGKAILFSPISGECDRGDMPKASNDALLSCAIAGDNLGVMGATIDGIQLKDLDQYRIQNKTFILHVPKDNIFDIKVPGNYGAAADGFIYVIKPLHPGKHVLRFTASIVNPLHPEYDISKDTTYNLLIS